MWWRRLACALAIWGARVGLLTRVAYGLRLVLLP